MIQLMNLKFLVFTVVKVDIEVPEEFMDMYLVIFHQDVKELKMEIDKGLSSVTTVVPLFLMRCL